MTKQESQRDDIAEQAFERLCYVVYLVLNAVRMRRRSRAFGSFSRTEKNRMIHDIDKRLHEPGFKKRLHELVSTALYDARHGPERAIMLSEAASRIHERILHELHEDDFHVTAQSLLNDYIELRGWFFESSVFEEWQNGGTWYLSCYGEPRCGKSAFAAAVARWLRNEYASDTKCAVVSLFLGHGQNKERYRSYGAVLQAVLRQLVESKGDHHHHQDSLQELREEVLRAVRESPDLLQEQVVRQMESYSKVFLIVDGLDDLATEATLKLLKENLIALVKLCAASTHGLRLMLVQSRTDTNAPTDLENACCDALVDSGTPCKQPCKGHYWRCEHCRDDFYVCRPCFELNRHCLDPSHILNVNVEIRSEVSKYIDAKLGSMKGQTRIGRLMSGAMSISSHIQKVINDLSGGTFVIAKLYIDSLIEQQSVDEVLDVLDRLPIYQRLYYNSLLFEIVSHPGPDKDLALTAMALIAAIQNTRRIYMTFEEFEAAITALTRRSILKFTKAHLIECTKGLLDISNNEVKPFHESAGTYLAEECEEVFVGDLLVDMADLCIRAMRDLGNGPSRPPTELWPKLEDMMQCLRDYPFIAYSMRHWTTYLGSSSSPDAMRAGLRLLDDFENDANIRRMMVLALNTSSSIGFWPGGSKLHVAAWLGFDAAFRETQQEDLALEINAQEPVKRRTPLHMACMRGHYHVALKILQMGADVSMQDRDGCTALWNAIDNSHVATVKVLLQGPHPAKGSKQMRQALNLRNPHYGDQTVLMLAIQRMNGDDQDKIAQLVLRQPDVDPNIQDSAGRTALHIAASLAYSTGLKILTSSRLNDLDFSLRDAAGCTPVIAAISSGQYLGENVQDLLTLFESASRHKTFDADVVEDNGRSLLHYAAMDEVYLPIVKHLKTLGAEINQRDSHNRTPLHNAAYYLKDAEADGVIQTLISMGADLSAEDEQGMTPYDWAVQKGQSWKEIIYHDRKSTQQQGYLIPWDWAFDNPDVFAEELHNVPDEVMDQADPTGCTLLHWAISTGESASVEFLLRSGRVDINAQDLTYNTALHIAIKDIGIGIEIVQLLLEHGADINVPGSWGRRPLEWAFDSQDCNHDFGVAVALIEGGAKLVLAQKKLQEVLRYAIRHDNLRAVEKLLDGGVGPFSYCRPGLLPSETAKEEGASEQMIEMLRHRENNVFGMVADG